MQRYYQVFGVWTRDFFLKFLRWQVLESTSSEATGILLVTLHSTLNGGVTERKPAGYDSVGSNACKSAFIRD